MKNDILSTWGKCSFCHFCFVNSNTGVWVLADFLGFLPPGFHARAVLSLSGILSLDWNVWYILWIFRDFGNFQKSMKMYERNYFSLFCKSHLIIFLLFIIGTPILCFTTSDSWIFRDFLVLFWGFLELHLWEPCPGVARQGSLSVYIKRTLFAAYLD